jgi:hypothetical protein
MKLLRNPFRKRYIPYDEMEVLICHFVVLSELLEGKPNCDTLSKMAEKELYKIRVHYPEFKRPTMEEAQTKIKAHVSAHPELYPTQP